MCHLLALTSDTFISPALGFKGLSVMQEGYDNTGVGILLKDLGGPFKNIKDYPILCGIFSNSGLKQLDRYMLDKGFTTKYKISFKLSKDRPKGVPQRDEYIIRAYDYPKTWGKKNRDELETGLMNIRLELKKMDENRKDMIVFTFWPDTIMIKEFGNPKDILEYLQLNRDDFSAKVMMFQWRQNIKEGPDLYTCHPFFLQGYATMTNGDNTAHVSNREFLLTRNFSGYNGFMSDDEIFTHTLHYTMSTLGLGIESFKHIITPLNGETLNSHPDASFLKQIKYSCRQLIIDGPNCIMGCLPDNTLFMVQDKKKLQPGIIGGNPGMFAFSSEICGLDAVLPDRDKGNDYQPMHMDTAFIPPERQKIMVSRQTDAFLLN